MFKNILCKDCQKPLQDIIITIKLLFNPIRTPRQQLIHSSVKMKENKMCFSKIDEITVNDNSIELGKNMELNLDDE